MNRSECKSEVVKMLSDSKLPSEVTDSIADHLVDAFEVPTTKSDSQNLSAGFGFGLVIRSWAIRDDDVNLLQALPAALAALYTSYTTTHSLGTAAILGVFGALSQVLRNIYRKSVKLTTNEIKVIAAIKASGHPLSEEEILARVETVGLSLQAIDQALKRLSEVTTRNGIERFVEKNAEGRWLLRGV